MNLASLAKAALLVISRDRKVLPACLALVLAIVLAPALIMTALTAVLLKVPAASEEDLARFRAAVEAVEREKDARIDWREVVAAATVICGNDFSNAPDPDTVIPAWIEETWEAGPPGSPPVVHYAVRPFLDALEQLGFSAEDVTFAQEYLESLIDRGD